jgi:hypothetical protein
LLGGIALRAGKHTIAVFAAFAVCDVVAAETPKPIN